MTHSTLKKRWPLVIGLALTVALVFASPVLAGEIEEDDGNVVIDEDEVIEDDYLFGGESLTVNGTIQGDLVAVGETITINGTVEGDLLAAGQTVSVNGEVQDDAYVGGFLVELGDDAVFSDELKVGAFSLEADTDSSVGGDLLFGAAQALLQGEIAGDVRGGGNGVQIDGTIGGDVEVGVGEPGQDIPGFFGPNMPSVASVPSGLTLGDDASIGGDLTYTSTVEVDIPSSVVVGDTDFDLEEIEDGDGERPDFRPGRRPGAALGYVAGKTVLEMVRRFITLTLIGLLIVWLGSKLLGDTVETFKARPWTSLGVGALGYVIFFGMLIVLPFVLILLAIVLGLISLGGLTGGVIAFGALGWGSVIVAFVTATSWLAKIVLGMWLGQLIWKAIQPEGTSLVPPLLIGVALTAVLTAIPLGLGWLLGLVIALFGLGAIILTLRERLGMGSPDEAGEVAPAV
jgi:hypothetical protein